MEYKHINDCWAALNTLRDVDDIDRTLEEFPRWSGDWSWEINDDGDVVVTNHYIEYENDNYDTRVLEQLSVDDEEEPLETIRFDELGITRDEYISLQKTDIVKLIDKISTYLGDDVSWHIYSDDNNSLTVWID